MTPQEQITYLAEKIMLWHEGIEVYCECKPWKDSDNKTVNFKFRCGPCTDIPFRKAWNPLEDWNHWRQVEEKVMEDDTLFVEYCKIISDVDTYESVFRFVAADLPTRVSALLSAHQELHDK